MIRRLRSNPYWSGIACWLLFVAIYVVVFVVNVPVTWYVDVLLALNAASFTLYGIDKMFAVGKSWRVPEKVLWLSAFCGGPVGAVAGMQLFRHKTKKTSFQFWLALVVLLEAMIVVFSVKTLL